MENQKGKLLVDGVEYDVMYGPLKKGGIESVWVTNRRSPERKAMLQGVDDAIRFIKRAGAKFEFTPESEVPLVPKKKIRPRFNADHDPSRTPRFNTDLDSREVKELLDQGIDPSETQPTAKEKLGYIEMKKLAAANGINSRVTKIELEARLKEQGLI